jgi:hypothetical protein
VSAQAFVASESADADGAADGASASRPAAVRLFCLLTARFGDVCLAELGQLFSVRRRRRGGGVLY